MSQAFLIAASQGENNALSGAPIADQARPILLDLFKQAGLQPQRLQEIHWCGGDPDYWLTSLIHQVGFSAEIARFQWPVAPLISHFVLQNAARSIETGARDLILLSQVSGERVTALLLASPAAVGRYNLAPRARIAACFSIGLDSKQRAGSPEAFLETARSVIEKSGEDLADVHLLAAERLPANKAVNKGFPSASWLNSSVRGGDYALLHALVSRLEEEKQRFGLLLSTGPQSTGLATLVERV